MKSVKITKTMLKDPALLLEKVGAVDGNQAYPSHVYMNDKDYRKLEQNLRKALRKEYPYLLKRKIDFSVGMTLLNIGPVNLKKGVQEGYLLVDERSIKKEIEKANQK